jgi:hypothetical protein
VKEGLRLYNRLHRFLLPIVGLELGAGVREMMVNCFSS